ncbi:MAG TPA: serine hydrolase [Pyrinomonadaceae bacterium]|nr:serine hydrolase [Pyrinomonadaceae bacterium]
MSRLYLYRKFVLGIRKRFAGIPRPPSDRARWILISVTLLLLTVTPLKAQDDITKKLEGFDAFMEKTLKDWNAPGIGVGIVVNDKLVFVKGYGYRDYEKKLPITAQTMFPIASNTKLFTAVAAGLLVEEGKLTWDRPIRESVHSIEFYDNNLNNSVTVRDMLAHRTGITRHDSIWYKSDYNSKELFERLKYLEPKTSPRQIYLYNNMMYAGVGYAIELKSGKTWEEFVREKILQPLDMKSTGFSIAHMLKQPDYGVPFTEKRDSMEIYRIPYYEETGGVGPAGSIVSNIEDLSHWLIALMNNGKYNGKQVLPAKVLQATLEPAIALPNTAGETRGWWEIINRSYGMGRGMASYRGRLITNHGGDLPGFHSQIAYLPNERIGVITFVIGNHVAPLYNPITYNVFERLLGMDQVAWTDRLLQIRLKNKKAGTEARSKAGYGRVANTNPSHPLSDYVGEYEHPAYGLLKIGLKDNQLQFDFHKVRFPMTHFHYDRFDTPDDEQDGKWSVNFLTNPQGDVDKATMSLDEAEATFKRRPPTVSDEMAQKLAGTYETPSGAKFQVVMKPGAGLNIVNPGQPEQKLIPYKPLKFRIEEFADVVIEFVEENGQITAIKTIDPSGEYVAKRK